MFFLRLHENEDAALTQRAAQHGLQRCDYARKRLFEEAIPALPPVIPNTSGRALNRLQQIKDRLTKLHYYVGWPDGEVEWEGQGEQGRHIFDEIEIMLNETEALGREIDPRSIIQPTRAQRRQGARLV